MATAVMAVVLEAEKPKRAKAKRQRKGSGCVYRPKFRTKEGKVCLGGWRIKFTWNHRTYDESVNVDSKQAAGEILKKRFAEIQSGQFVKGSEAETLRYEDMRGYLFREYEMNHCKSLSTAKDGEKYIGHLKHIDEFFRGRLALDIDARLLDEFILERQRAGASNGTINRTFNLLRRMFHLAVDQKKLRGDQVPKFKMLKEARPRSGFLEPEGFPRLRQELPEYLRPILTLAYYTGMRSGEILNLKWSNVDLLNGEIRLQETKNDQPRTIPLIGESGELLKIERMRYPGCEWVFSRDGRNPMTSLRKAWKSACVRAGLGRFTCRTCGGELGTKLRCVSCQKRCASPRYVGLIFHDLRRSGVRNLDRAGVPQHVAMKISGHKTDSVYRRYNIVSDRDLKEAGRRVNAYVSDRISQTLVKVDAETPAESVEAKPVIQ